MAIVCRLCLDIVIIGGIHLILGTEQGAVETILKTCKEIVIVILCRLQLRLTVLGGSIQICLLAADLIPDHFTVQFRQKLPLLHIVAHLHMNAHHGIAHGGIHCHALGTLHRTGGRNAAAEIRVGQHGGIGKPQHIALGTLFQKTGQSQCQRRKHHGKNGKLCLPLLSFLCRLPAAARFRQGQNLFFSQHGHIRLFHCLRSFFWMK